MTKRILIIEDDPVNGRVVGDFLEAHGYETTLATSGSDGLRSFHEDPPDLAIIDVLLPHMNGFEVAFKIRQGPEGRNVPVLLMSAIYTDQENAEAYAKGSLEVQAYLVKPFDLSELLSQVKRLLEKEPAAPE